MVAPTASADGYGCSAEALVLAAVKDHGADIGFIEHDWRDSRFSSPEFLAMRVTDCAADYREVMVVYFLPFALARFRSRITIGMSMWETDRLPDSWAAACNWATGYIVPSQHSYEVFQPRISCPIEVVPFGTDTDFFTAYTHTRLQDGLTRFLMTGLLHYRKGLEFALRAFREEFSPTENVSLTLKTRNGFLDAGNESAVLDDPRVHVIDEDYTRRGMRELYWYHDCLLAPSRGEGSGLTPRDAMSTAMPVILTDWSGLTEIADERYNWPVGVEDFEPVPNDCSSYRGGITGGGDIGNMARPSVPDIRAAMRQIHEDKAEARRRGLEAADWMRREFTWERSAWLWLKALERLSVRYVSET